jgi:hypothetical protein
MIKVEINGDKRNFSDINPSWINEQVRKRQEDGAPVCLKIYIQQTNINIVLPCGDCVGGSVGGRTLNPQEDKIYSLWNRSGCKEKPINPGKIIAFLNQIK